MSPPPGRRGGGGVGPTRTGGRVRGSSGGDHGDTIGPGESLADGCWRFVRGFLLLLILAALCLFLAVISGGDQ